MKLYLSLNLKWLIPSLFSQTIARNYVQRSRDYFHVNCNGFSNLLHPKQLVGPVVTHWIDERANFTAVFVKAPPVISCYKVLGSAFYVTSFHLPNLAGMSRLPMQFHAETRFAPRRSFPPGNRGKLGETIGYRTTRTIGSSADFPKKHSSRRKEKELRLRFISFFVS